MYEECKDMLLFPVALKFGEQFFKIKIHCVTHHRCLLSFYLFCKNIYLFSWLTWVSVSAQGALDLCCRMWDL